MCRRIQGQYEPEMTIYDYSHCCPTPCFPSVCNQPECNCTAQIKNIITQLITLFSAQTVVTVTVVTNDGSPFTGIPAALFPSGTNAGLFTLKNAVGVITSAISICSIASISVSAATGLATITYLPSPCQTPNCDVACEHAIRTYVATIPAATNIVLTTSFNSAPTGTVYRNEFGVIVLLSLAGLPTFVNTCDVDAVSIANGG